MPLERNRGLAAVALVVGALLHAGCSGDQYCRLVIEDPEGHAGGGDELVLVHEGAEAAREALPGPLPLTWVMRSAHAGKVPMTLEVWAGGAASARASVTLLFSDKTETVTARLGRACDDVAACDDGVFANGDEACVAGVCRPGSPPCVAPVPCVDVEASEEAKACVITARHDRCEPIEAEGGALIPTYCDAVAGCIPGEACTDEGAQCAHDGPCDQIRTCTSGRCVPSGSVVVDDDNSCTLDVCDPASGIVHLTPDTFDGNSCSLLDESPGICLAGTCAPSRCGDGYQDVTLQEECDEGEANSDTESDRCRTDCTPARCGDLVVDLGEDCDDGNISNQDACLASCRANVCGDGIVNVGVEECDDGNFFSGDSCLPGCVANVCGDGVRDFTEEECDDGNTVSFDGCSARCDFVAWEVDLAAAIAQGSAPVAWTAIVLDNEGTPQSVNVLGVVTAAGTLVVLDRATGVELWRYDAADPVSSSPAVGTHGVYFVTTSGVVHGNALSGPAGRAPWTFALDAPAGGAGLAVSSGPLNDAVIAVDSAARLYHLKANGARGTFNFAQTGTAASPDLRTYEALEACTGCVPTAVGDLTPGDGPSEDGLPGLILPADTGVWGWDLANDGTPTRLSTEPAISQVAYRGFYGSFATSISGLFAYFTSRDGALHAATFSSGPEVDAETSTTGVAPFTLPPIVTIDPSTTRDAIFVADSAGRLYRFVRSVVTSSAGVQSFSLVPSPRWPVQLDAILVAPPAMGFGGTLFAADAAGHVHALDELSALELWRFDLGGPASGSPLPTDRAVFVATTPGRIFALERGTEEAPSTLWSRQGRSASGNGTAPQCGHGAGGAGLGLANAFALAVLGLAFRARRHGGAGGRREP